MSELTQPSQWLSAAPRRFGSRGGLPYAAGVTEAASDRLLRTGVIVFAVGAVFSVVTLVPFLVGASPLPTWVYALSVLAPIGLAIVLYGLWRKARRHGRATRAAQRAARPSA